MTGAGTVLRHHRAAGLPTLGSSARRCPHTPLPHAPRRRQRRDVDHLCSPGHDLNGRRVNSQGPSAENRHEGAESHGSRFRTASAGLAGYAPALRRRGPPPCVRDHACGGPDVHSGVHRDERRRPGPPARRVRTREDAVGEHLYGDADGGDPSPRLAPLRYRPPVGQSSCTLVQHGQGRNHSYDASRAISDGRGHEAPWHVQAPKVRSVSMIQWSARVMSTAASNASKDLPPLRAAGATSLIRRTSPASVLISAWRGASEPARCHRRAALLPHVPRPGAGGAQSSAPDGEHRTGPNTAVPHGAPRSPRPPPRPERVGRPATAAGPRTIAKPAAVEFPAAPRRRRHARPNSRRGCAGADQNRTHFIVEARSREVDARRTLRAGLPHVPKVRRVRG